jgi:hypothetical protein
MFFILNAHAADALAPIDIKGPHRDAVMTCDSREKTGKEFGGIIVADYEFTLFIE